MSKTLLAAFSAGAAIIGGLLLLPAAAQSPGEPPVPGFARIYGRVSLDGDDITPAEGRVVAFVRGRACGSGTTLVAPTTPETPEGDRGRTVYVVDVYPAGNGPGQLPGCAVPGDAIRLYFPDTRRFAFAQPVFAAAPLRADVVLGPELSQSRILPLIARDGVP
jgi:hypothetical protein